MKTEIAIGVWAALLSAAVPLRAEAGGVGAAPAAIWTAGRSS